MNLCSDMNGFHSQCVLGKLFLATLLLPGEYMMSSTPTFADQILAPSRNHSQNK
jgi:hypothetical protein